MNQTDQPNRNRSPEEGLVRRYFSEVVDERNAAAVPKLFAPDCRIVRADRTRPLIGVEALQRFVQLSIRAVPEISTHIEAVVDDRAGNLALVVTHKARFGPVVITPLGIATPYRRTAEWRAMALFRIRDGRIVEEQVIRDEIAILRDLGLVGRHSSPIIATLMRWLGGPKRSQKRPV